MKEKNLFEQRRRVIEIAQAQWDDPGVQEIDDEAEVIDADGGFWVQTWSWVDREDVEYG